MNTLYNRKKGVMAIAMSFAIAGLSVFFAPAASADHQDDPEIDKVKDRGRQSVELRIEDERFKKEKVRVRVTIRNRETGEMMTKHFTQRLDKEGKETIRIGGLKPDTKYGFRVRVKEWNDKHYKGKSDYENVTTRV